MQFEDTPVEALIKRVLDLPEAEEDVRARLVADLHARGDREVFLAARRLCASPVARERVLGADILGQLGYLEGRPFVEETLPVLSALCRSEADPEVLAAALVALGHLGDRRALDTVLRFTAHPDADVRESVAFALPALATEASGEAESPAPAPDARLVSALIALMQDEADEVRDWATNGLGSRLEVDSPQVRDALARRLDDENPDIAGEALLGLARRKDPRAYALVPRRLTPAQADTFVLEAAAELAEPSLLPLLQALSDSQWAESDIEKEWLSDALERCR